MVKICLYIIFIIGLQNVCLSQNMQSADSFSNVRITTLRQNLQRAKNDSDRIIALQNMAFFFERLNADSSLTYYSVALDLARQKSYAWGEARLSAGLSGLMEHQGKYAEAFELLFKSLKIAETSNSAYDIARANRRISGIYFELQNYRKAIDYLLKALPIDKASGLKDKVAIDHYALANAYEKLNQLDSAAYHIDFALKQKNLLPSLMQYVYEILGHIQQKKGNYSEAALSYRKGMDEALLNNDLIATSQLCNDFSVMYNDRNQKDSATFYALKGFNAAKEISFKKGIIINGNMLAELYDSTQPSLALKYYKVAADTKDSLFGVTTIQVIQNLVSTEEAKQRELDDAKQAYQNKIKWYGLLTGVTVLLIIAFILYRNNRQKQIANELLRKQKEEIQTTLNELKITQTQLIQKEKMASLGELTAGIAHEIQNPLNFVNNYSEVSAELVDELDEEAAAGNTQEVKAIANDLRQNLQKITQHGQRASSIVKGMLEHSRTTSGERQSTDLNRLADEYLRLAYQGLRRSGDPAKDPDFQCELITDFDPNLGEVEGVAPDIGRVLLNLYNNTFYAVRQKQVLTDQAYTPTVWVSTQRLDQAVEIRVRDNGIGIPEAIREKIFQPFFTTKPTGEGTGLGLSLAYDIVTKGHGGTMEVESEEGEGTTFVVKFKNK